MKLNLGCGKEKIDGFVNVDINPDLKPDLCFDIRKPFPFQNGEVDEIWFIHCIEHIEDRFHHDILLEINRCLRRGGILVIAYPEFTECALGYIENRKGGRDFFKRTIYGRQSSPYDYHVSLMDSNMFIPMLLEFGFDTERTQQVGDPYYTVVRCTKVRNTETKEDIIRREVCV